MMLEHSSDRPQGTHAAPQGVVSRVVQVIVILMLIGAALIVAPESAYAQACECAAALVPSKEQLGRDTRSSLHYLNVLDERSYEAAKRAGGGGITVPIKGVPVQFSGSYSDFLEARKSHFSKQRFDTDDAESVRILRSWLSRDQLRAWTDCLRICSTGGGLSCTEVSNGPTSAKVRVDWRPHGDQRGVVTSSEIIGGTVKGAPAEQLFADGLVLPAGGTSILVRRAEGATIDLVLNVNGYPCELTIDPPPPPPPPPPPTPPPPPPPCPTPREERCQVTVSAAGSLVTVPGCGFSVLTAPENVSLGRVYYMKVFAGGREFKSEGTYMTQGQAVPFEVNGKNWRAQLGALSPNEPYPANVTFERVCP